LIVIGGVLAQAFKNKFTQAEQSNEQVKSMIDNNIKTELKDEVATNDKTISRDLCINRDD
jgi:2-keto-4-pentenoate hydratase